MKKFILSLFLLGTASLFSVEEPPLESEYIESNFGYYSLSAGPFPLWVPSIGLGYRSKLGSLGWDNNLRLTIVLAVSELRYGVSPLFYFNNTPTSGYAGFGLSASALITPGYSFSTGIIPTKAYVAVGPQFLIGKQYNCCSKTQRFWQLEVSYPHYHITKPKLFLQDGVWVVFTYGASF